MARNSRSVERFYTHPSPRESLLKFSRFIQHVIAKEAIDVLIPTCEEVFYLAAIKHDIEPRCEVFCPDFDVIRQLHSKLDILTLCAGLGISIPKTQVMTPGNLTDDAALSGAVVKREFSRFGTGVWLSPTIAGMGVLSRDHSARYIMQEKISGTEICTYAISVDGVVHADVMYRPSYRVRKSAGVYFTPIENALISTFVQAFCAKHKYTGQIGFDMIINDQGIYVLECNPRATSGMHLLAQINMASIILDKRSPSATASIQPKMIRAAMWLMSVPVACVTRRVRSCLHDMSLAKDVLYQKNDQKYPCYLLLSFLELLIISIKKRVSLRSASTADIEWDGDKMV